MTENYFNEAPDDIEVETPPDSINELCDNCGDSFEILRRYIGTSDIYCPYCQVKQ